MFGVLLRARVQMARNTARAAPIWQQAVLGLLCVFGLLLFAAIAALCAGLLLLAQGGTPLANGLSPTASSLVSHVYEYLFLFLLAGSAPFMAGTLFQSNDLPLLLTTPVSPRAVVAAKLMDAIGVNAAQFVALGVPVLAGIGWAAHLNASGWLWLLVATLLLLTLPPSVTALLLLLAARWLGMRRVRTAVTLVSIGLGLAITGLAVVGASRAARSGALDIGRVQAALRGEGGPPAPNNGGLRGAARPSPAPPLARPEPSYPLADVGAEGASSWAAAMLDTTAGGQPLRGRGLLGLLLLAGTTALTVALCLLVGPSVIASEAFLEQSDGLRRRVGPELLGANVPGLSRPVAGLLVKDSKYVVRDLVLLGQIGTALILFLVPFLLRLAQGASAGLEDLYGALALAMTGMIVYMVTSIVSLSSVGLEGRGFWIVLSAPVSVLAFLRAKWLGAFGLSAVIASVLLLAAWPAFALPAPTVAVALALCGCACFALSGLGVGLAGLFPRFVYENPAHRASAWALILGFVLATGYIVLCGLLAGAAYLLTTQGILPLAPTVTGAVGAFLLLSAATGWLPVTLAARRLQDYEWET